MMPETVNPREGTALRRLDFKKYTGVLKALLSDALAIVICDDSGRRIWSLSRGEKSVYKQALAQINDSVPDWPHTGAAIRRCTIDDAHSAYLTSLQAHDGPVTGALMVLVSHRQDSNNGAFSRISEGMSSVSRLLGDEALMLDELGAVTRELTRRYEELNLIYNTQDSVKYFDEGQDAIRHLVRNTCEYTGFAFAALIMADQNTVHSFSNPVRPLATVEALREVVRADLYEHVAFRKEVLVHNGGKRHLHLLAGIQCKLLACPVFDENSDVIGVLVLANEASAPALVSSDRKLLQVMAHKASRIIQANYDALTGMMTRNGFEYHLETGLYLVRYKQVQHTILNINVDRLHVVNDTCGHHAGDALIRRVAAAIRSALGPEDVVARLGGGEFGVLLVEREDLGAEDVAESIRSAVREVEFFWDNRRFQVSVSIGLAPMEADTQSVVSVMSAAEVACAAAKDLGRDRVQVYQIDNTMLVRRKAQIHWLGHLHSALREDRFELYCQPIRGVGVAQAHHAEILLRLRDDHDGMLTPDVFLGSAERYNLMPAIDRWVIRNTMKMLTSNLPKSLLREQVWAINLSGQTLSDSNFMQFILDETKRAGISPKNLCFEVTETAAVANLKEAGQFIADLREHGYAFSLDDFGSGLSSFAYLKALPVDYLKIDGSIAKEVVKDPVSASMVRAICQVAQDMGLETIAEFVEDAELEIRLATLGVDYVQGHAVGRPQPLRDTLSTLTDRLLVQSGDEDTCTVPSIDEAATPISELRANL